VDDIIFGGSSHSLVSSFQEMMDNEFQLSMMGELTFFLGIQIKEMKQGTFVHQTKYTKDLMKKFNMAGLKIVSTPMSMTTSLGPYEDGESIDQREHDWLPPVPHDDMTGHSVHRVPVCVPSDFPTLFASDDSSVNLQVSQTHTHVLNLVCCFFFARSCWFFQY
jgi:hypothetical protein